MFNSVLGCQYVINVENNHYTLISFCLIILCIFLILLVHSQLFQSRNQHPQVPLFAIPLNTPMARPNFAFTLVFISLFVSPTMATSSGLTS